MSDYLGNLAARTLKPPAVRPRLRSLFEPAAISPSMASPEVEQHIEVREVSPSARPTSAPVSPPPSLHASTPPPDLRRALTAQPAPPIQSSVPVLAPIPPPVPPAAAQRTDVPVLPVVDESHASRPLEAPPSPPPAHITHRVERLEKQTTLIQSHSQESVRLVETREPSIAADRAPAPRVTPSLPPHESRAASPVAHTTPIDRPVERPDIHISIGRVIVNAPAASHAPKPAPPPPTPMRLTLDQYLRQRGGRS